MKEDIADTKVDWPAFAGSVLWATLVSGVLGLVLSGIIWGAMQFTPYGLSGPDPSSLMVLPIIALPFGFIDGWGAGLRFHVRAFPAQLNVAVMGIAISLIFGIAMVISALFLLETTTMSPPYLSDMLEGEAIVPMMKVTGVCGFGLCSVLMAGAWISAPGKDSLQTSIFGRSLYR